MNDRQPTTPPRYDDSVELTQEDIANCISGFMQRSDEKLFAKSREELEQCWHFRFDEHKTAEARLYAFHDALALYGSMCSQWEEHHNGYVCVVERVRDQYLMPKIREFLRQSEEVK